MFCDAVLQKMDLRLNLLCVMLVIFLIDEFLLIKRMIKL